MEFTSPLSRHIKTFRSQSVGKQDKMRKLDLRNWKPRRVQFDVGTRRVGDQVRSMMITIMMTMNSMIYYRGVYMSTRYSCRSPSKALLHVNNTSVKLSRN